MPDLGGAERAGAGRAVAAARDDKKKDIHWASAWAEARTLIWAHRARLSLGLSLMVVSRLAGLVLPATSKYLIDDVVGKGRHELLVPLALAAGGATFVQAGTAFALSQVLGVAAQKAITDMRRRVQAHIAHLPVRYFDTTQTGVLISRVMNDAEGIRNLVGNGLVQLLGSMLTGLLSLGVLFYLNWRLTTVTILVLAVFGGGDGGRLQAPAAAVPRARPDHGRGHRAPEPVARRHPRRQGLHRREARGTHLHARAPTASSGTSRSRSPASRPSPRARP